MNNDSFGAFLARIENDAVLRQELRAAGFDAGMETEGLIAFAARKGYSLTIDDGGELADDQLDKVAGGTGDGDSLKLQEYMDRQSKFMSTLSNMMKKMSDTSSGIVSNLK